MNIGEADDGAVVKEESMDGACVDVDGKGDANDCDGDAVIEIVDRVVELPAVGISVVAIPEGIFDRGPTVG